MHLKGAYLAGASDIKAVLVYDNREQVPGNSWFNGVKRVYIEKGKTERLKGERVVAFPSFGQEPHSKRLVKFNRSGEPTSEDIVPTGDHWFTGCQLPRNGAGSCYANYIWTTTNLGQWRQTYGPYVYLPAGKYQYEWDIDLYGRPADPAYFADSHHWNYGLHCLLIDVVYGGGNKTIRQDYWDWSFWNENWRPHPIGPIGQGKDGIYGVAYRNTFELSSPESDIEVRTWVSPYIQEAWFSNLVIRSIG